MSKKILMILVIFMVMATISALPVSYGMKISYGSAEFDSENGYSDSAMSVSLDIGIVSKSTGLSVYGQVGTGWASESSLNGKAFTTYPFSYFRRVNSYNAQIGIRWTMPMKYGLKADVHALWQDSVFTEGGTKDNWERESFHTLGYGWSIGAFVKVSKNLIISIGYGQDYGLKTYMVQRSRQDRITSEGVVSELSGSFKSQGIFVMLSAEI